MILFVLLTSTIILYSQNTTGAGETYLKIVNPLTGDGLFDFNTIQKSVGDTFVINITIEDVELLFAWQIALKWNDSQLAYANVSIPPDNILGTLLTVGPPVIVPGMLIFGALDSTISGRNGSGTLAQVTLRIIQPVNSTHQLIQSGLTFENLSTDTFLLDVTLQDINFNPTEGSYSYRYTPTIQGFWYPTCPYPYVPSNQTRINEAVIVKANLSGFAVGDVVFRFRRQDQDWFNTTMLYNTTDELWTQTIPAQNQNCTMEFLLDVRDTEGLIITSSTYSFYVKPLPTGDINGDGTTNMRDIQICILNFGKHA